METTAARTAARSANTNHLMVTVQQHILHEQRKRFPEATGAFSGLLSGITLATKMTQAKVRRAGLLGGKSEMEEFRRCMEGCEDIASSVASRR